MGQNNFAMVQRHVVTKVPGLDRGLVYCCYKCAVMALPDLAGVLTLGDVASLRDVWEATGFRLEREQAAEETVEAERRGLAAREAPAWTLPYTPTWTPDEALRATDKPRVAILRCTCLLRCTPERVLLKESPD